jgi:hypothetical protein
VTSLFPDFSSDKEQARLRTSALEAGEPLVHARHFPLEAFYFQGNQRNIRRGYTPAWVVFLSPEQIANLSAAVAGLGLPPPEKKPKADVRGRDFVCICKNQSCSDNLFLTGEHHRLPKNETTANLWLKHLCPGASSQEKAKLKAMRSYVSRKHFQDFQLESSRDGKVSVKDGEAPTLKLTQKLHESAGMETENSMELLQCMGEIRKIVGDTLEVGAVRQLGVLMLESRKSVKKEEDDTEEEVSNEEKKFCVLEAIRESEQKCRYYTGEPSFEVLVALFEYLDCDGFFTTMRLYSTLTGATFGQAQAQKRAGRPQKLSVFEQFVAFMVIFKRFRKDIEHVADLFSVGVSAMERYYETWVLGLAVFANYQQPFPTCCQLLAMTPARVRAALDLPLGASIVFGDCTETQTHDPGTAHPAEHSALFSEYKSRTTVKYLTACSGSSYLFFVSSPLCGGASDQAAHSVTGLAARLPRPIS